MSNHARSSQGPDHGELEDHDLGLSHDLPRIIERNRIGRRGLFAVFGGIGALAVAGCASGTSDTVTDTAATTDTPPGGGPGGTPPDGAGGGGEASDVAVADGEIPEETAGPYPGDGSNGPDALAESGVVRSDMTTSFGDAAGVAEGVPTTVNLKVYDLNGDTAAPLVGAAIYLWHCNNAGQYSMYDDEIADENYLRGVQETDAEGNVTFTTIFPAAYSGRWPHMHFEIYQSLADATSSTNKLRTSQLALPEDACNDVYANTDGYEASVANMARTTLDSDNVFSDGYSLQLAKATGSAADGYTVSLNIPV